MDKLEKPQRPVIQVRVEYNLLQQAKAKAEEKETTLSDVIRAYLKRWTK